MKNINLIYLRNGKILLDFNKYHHWKKIQEQYDEYMTSMDFQELHQIIEFLKTENNLSDDKTQQIIEKINKTTESVIEIDF